ncbi:MAG: hypothetical protein SOY85_10125 [Blautia sp.]|uniref:hypothetical protein n=1 Tax=Blautia TaxID=572511 RepID=UPI001D061AC3|nr:MULTISPECIES: hypothetical protein [Blautia]MCB6725638.1 hypothetical protein [Blautia marasmi]MCQ4740350.1 hypothetical protein [Blautia hominis]MCQ5096313.1 hypothetical protein [Blautia producta]MDY4055224.1 hypothetical protein [Blautia sp.]
MEIQGWPLLTRSNTIPSTVTIGADNNSQDINITVDSGTLKLVSGKKIKITSDVDASKVLKLSEEAKTEVQIDASVEVPSANYFDKDNTNQIKYTITKPASVDYAGTYKGTINFIVTYE